jgi:hypothetical protein
MVGYGFDGINGRSGRSRETNPRTKRGGLDDALRVLGKLTSPQLRCRKRVDIAGRLEWEITLLNHMGCPTCE